MTGKSRQIPANILISCAAAVIVYPMLWLIDWGTRPCGDGLCAFFPSLIGLGALGLVTIIFLVRSIARKEQPALLQFLPLVLWLLLAKPLFI